MSPGNPSARGTDHSTMAEYFRDGSEPGRAAVHRQHLPLTQAGSEVSNLLGRMPSAVGYYEPGRRNGSVAGAYYPPPAVTPSPSMQALTCLRMTTPTCRQPTTCAPGCDHRESGTHRAVCTRQLTRCPPPRILDAQYIGQHYDTAIRVKAILQENKELQDIIAILVWTSFRGAEDCRGTCTSY